MYSTILSHLWDLNKSSLDIQGLALSSTDGLILATTLPENFDEDNVAAISAGAFVLGTHTSKECAGGSLEQILIKCKERHVLMTQAKEEYILTALMHPHCNLDLAFIRVKQWAEKISLLL